MKYKLKRKKYAKWHNGLSISVNPIVVYVILKTIAAETMVHEWLWWVYMPLAIVCWLFLFQFSIKKY